MVINNINNGTGTIVLTPNCSASWRINKLLILGLGSITLLLAFTLALAGAWVIMPFAGLEVGLLAYFMHRVCRATHSQQVLFVEPDRLRLEAGVQHPVSHWQFERHQAFLRIGKPRHSLDTQPIFLCDLHEQVELGKFLNSSDKKQLIQLASAAGLSVRHANPVDEVRLPA